MSGSIIDLGQAIAAVTGFPRESVAMLATHLRRGGLIPGGPRGRWAPRMGAPETASLLLGLLAHRQLQDGPRAVRLARSLRLERFVDVSGFEDGPEPPPEGLFGLPRDHTLGEIVEALLEEYRHGDAAYPPTDLPITRLGLDVTVPGHTAVLRLWSGGWAWGARYSDRENDEELRARLVEEHRENWQAAIKDYLAERYGATGGDLEITRAVSDETFYALGAFLRFGLSGPENGG